MAGAPDPMVVMGVEAVAVAGLEVVEGQEQARPDLDLP